MCWGSDGTVEKCGSEICRAEGVSSRVSYQQRCVTGVFSWFATIELKLTIDIDFVAHESDQALTFTCKYNECNGHQAIGKMQNRIDQVYNITSITEVFAEAAPVGTPSSSSQSTGTSTTTGATATSSILSTHEHASSQTPSELQVTIDQIITNRSPSPASSLIRNTTTAIPGLSLQSSLDSTHLSVTSLFNLIPSNEGHSVSNTIYGSSDLSIALLIGVLLFFERQ